MNGWSPLDARLPWGGSRRSGHGRELGWAGLEANTALKTVTVVLDHPIDDNGDLPG